MSSDATRGLGKKPAWSGTKMPNSDKPGIASPDTESAPRSVAAAWAGSASPDSRQTQSAGRGCQSVDRREQATSNLDW